MHLFLSGFTLLVSEIFLITVSLVQFLGQGCLANSVYLHCYPFCTCQFTNYIRDFSHNFLSGTIEEEIVRIVPYLQEMFFLLFNYLLTYSRYLDDNMLSGSIPSSFANFVFLWLFHFPS